MTRIGRYMPGLPKDQHLRQTGLVKIVMNGQVLPLSPGRCLGRRRQAPGLVRAARGERAEEAHRVHRRLPGGGDERPPLRARVPGPRPGADPLRRAGRARRQGQPGPAVLRLRRVVPGAEQRGQRDRALPRPARLHPDLGRPDLRARPDPRALRRVRLVHPHRRALLGHRRQVPGRRDDDHLRDEEVEPPGPPERGADRHPLPGDAGRLREAGRHLLQDGDRRPPRPGLPGAVHGRRGDGADHGHRPQRQPRGPALLGLEEADRGGRGRGAGAARAPARLRVARHRRRVGGPLQRGHRHQPRHPGPDRGPDVPRARATARSSSPTTSCTARWCSATRGMRSSRASARACLSTRSTSRSPDGPALHSLETRLRDLGGQGAGLCLVPGGRRRGRRGPAGRPSGGCQLRGHEPLPLRRGPRHGGAATPRGAAGGRERPRSSGR